MSLFRQQDAINTQYPPHPVSLASHAHRCYTFIILCNDTLFIRLPVLY